MDVPVLQECDGEIIPGVLWLLRGGLQRETTPTGTEHAGIARDLILAVSLSVCVHVYSMLIGEAEHTGNNASHILMTNALHLPWG